MGTKKKDESEPAGVTEPTPPTPAPAPEPDVGVTTAVTGGAMQVTMEGKKAEPVTPDPLFDGKFSATIDAEFLGAFIKPLQALVDEARLEVSRDGFRAAVVDPAHVAMTRATLERSAFENLEVVRGAKDGESFALGVDLEKVQEVLALAAAAGQGTLVHVETYENGLKFRIGPVTRRMCAIDLSGLGEDPRVPNLILPARIRMRTADLRLAIKASGSVSDHVALVAKDGTFRVIAEGDTDDAALELHQGEDEITVEGAHERQRSLFPLDYFENTVRSVVAETLELQIGNDYPFRMTWRPTITRKVGDQAVDHVLGEVVALVAPRIESE